MTRDEFFAMPAISSYFPLTFEGKVQKWTTFTVHCGDCGDKPIPQDRTRGYIVPMSTEGSYREIPYIDAYHITANGLCPDCERMTTVDYILDDSSRLIGKNPKTDEVCTWVAQKVKSSLWQRIKNFFA